MFSTKDLSTKSLAIGFALGATSALIIAHVLPSPSWCNVKDKANGEENEKPALASIAKSRPVLEKIRAVLTVSKEFLSEKVIKGMVEEATRGLAGDDSTLQMLPTFVTGLPTGEEKGFCYGIDFGGTNLRVLKVPLLGNSSLGECEEFKKKIPDEMMSAHGSELFDFLADHVTSSGMTAADKCGFCFSFPVRKTSLATGVLTCWTKGFTNAGVVGEDVVGLLCKSLKKRQKDEGKDSPPFVDAIVNDTVGTLMSCAYIHPSCRLGVILGTGCNAAYVEKSANIASLPSNDGHMIINTEWGNFGSSPSTRRYLPISSADELLDKNSNYPGKQLFEKMTAGMYLGEIAANCLQELVDASEIWASADRSGMNLESLSSIILSKVEAKDTGRAELKAIVEDLGVKNSTDEDIDTFLEVCQLVSKRAARLSAAGIAAFVAKMGGQKCIAGIDGSLFCKHPTFRASMVECLSELSCQCVLKEASDGSGIGAALVAASAS